NGPHVYEVPGADITKFEQQPNVLQRRIWLYRRGQPIKPAAQLTKSTRSKAHDLSHSEWAHPPPAPQVQPISWARFTPQVPDGMIVMPGSRLLPTPLPLPRQ